jgi:Trypsin-like peptidase domain
MFGLEAPASQLLYSTVMVVATLANGESSTGTAFFYQFKVDSQRMLVVLVTNKHVVADAQTVRFRVHEAIVNKETGKREPSRDSFEVATPKGWFIDHPGEVDLCAMPFELVNQVASKQGKEIFFISLSDDVIPNDERLRELSALEDVVMVGYPIGLSDIANNFPLMRKGITASHPFTDFNAKPWGAVDIASFPGSSGSPILLMNQGAYGSSGGWVIGNRALLLGVLFAGPQYKADGTFDIKEIPTGKTRVSVVTTSMPMHLGFYVKAKELNVLKDHLFKSLKIH